MAGSIEKRGENTYRLVVSSGTGPGGHRKKYSKTIKCTSDHAAEKELAKFLTKVESNDFTEPNKITFEDFCKRWLKDYAEKNLAPKTFFSYNDILKSRVFPALGHIKIAKLKPMHFVEFYSMLQEDGIRKDGKKGGLSSMTINYHHRLIHDILEFAVKWEVISSNPCDRVDTPKVSKIKAKSYDNEEVSKLMNALLTVSEEDLKYKVAIILTLATGFRLGELVGLKWDNVDFVNNTINIVHSNQYIPGKGTITKSPKNETSKRTIFVADLVMDLLQSYKVQQDTLILKKGTKWVKEDYIFTQWNGKPVYPSTPSKWFGKFLKANNLKIITFHQLRHTMASLLINSGMNINTTSERLGHANTSTTLNIYSHSSKSADKEAADRLGAIIFPPKKLNEIVE